MMRNQKTPFRLTPFEDKIVALYDIGFSRSAITVLMGLKPRKGEKVSQGVHKTLEKREEIVTMAPHTPQDGRRTDWITIADAKNRGRAGRFS